MILGMSAATYTLVHVLISVIGIVTGLFVLLGMLNGKRFDQITALFLATTALTSITGFGFPFEQLLASHVLGIISLATLALAIPARYMFGMRGIWRTVYVVGAMIALYLNLFVFIVQSFEKIPGLKALAPTQKEAPFVATQLAVLVALAILTFIATRKFRPELAAA
jgi:hypothetical protein